MNPLALPFVVLALFIAWDGKTSVTSWRWKPRANPTQFHGIRRKRLSEEPWATEESRADVLREAGLI